MPLTEFVRKQLDDTKTEIERIDGELERLAAEQEALAQQRSGAVTLATALSNGKAKT